MRRPEDLDQQSGERHPKRLAPERDEAVGAVDASLQLIGNQREAIGELHRVVYRPRP